MKCKTLIFSNDLSLQRSIVNHFTPTIIKRETTCSSASGFFIFPKGCELVR